MSLLHTRQKINEFLLNAMCMQLEIHVQIILSASELHAIVAQVIYDQPFTKIII